MKTAILLIAFFGLACAATQDPIPEEAHFECADSGKFPHPDPTQEKFYFLCALNNDGYLIAHLVSCTDDQHFDAESRKCVNTVEHEFTCLASGRFPHPLNIKKYILCEANEEGLLIPKVQLCEDDAIFDHKLSLCVRQEVPEHFECPDSGRFPHPTKEDHFYMCYLNSDGYLIHQLIQCATNFVYNKDTQVCEHDFVCPDSGRFIHPVRNDKFYFCWRDTEGNLVHKVVDCAEGLVYNHDLKYCAAPEAEITCSATGRFPHPTKKDQFVLCWKNPQGDWEHKLYSCAEGLHYNHELKVCAEPESIFECPDSGAFPHPTKKDHFYFCALNNDGYLIHKLFNCPSGYLFNEVSKVCEFHFECSDSGRFPHPLYLDKFFMCWKELDGNWATKVFDCAAGLHYNHELKMCAEPEPYFECPDSGRFPHPTKKDHFYMCYLSSEGFLIHQLIQCATNFVYNKDTQVCEHDFVCPDSGRFIHPVYNDKFYFCWHNSEGNLVHKVIDCAEGLLYDHDLKYCAAPEAEITCSATGRFPHPTKKDQFVLCWKNLQGDWEHKLYSCTEGLHYNHELKVCAEPEFIFECPDSGAFPHPTKKDQFYFCALNTDGYLIHKLYSCPSDHLFNEVSRVCEFHFECPDSGRFSHPLYLDKFFMCWKELDGNWATKVIDCAAGLHYNHELKVCAEPEAFFECPDSGRFPHPTKEDQYYMCWLEDGYLVHKLYACLEGFIYNAEYKICARPQTFECQAEGDFPHETNHRAFYRCTLNEDGYLIATASICSPDYHFSTLLSRCIPDDIPFFECPAAGDFPHEGDNTKFYRCELNEHGFLIAHLLACTSDSYFDTHRRSCIRFAEKDFTCSTEGRFIDETSVNHYYICELHRGELIARHIACPGGLEFDERSKLCGIIRFL